MTRSIFGWSYPPGVTESMLPGNSREEQEQEALVDALYDVLAPFRKFYDSEAGEGDDLEDEVVTKLEVMMGDAYARGAADAQSTEAQVRELQPTHADDLIAFIELKGLKEEFSTWLSTQPLRS